MKRRIILGAGPSGLGVGIGLTLNGMGGETLLIEKGKTPGGLSRSIRWKENSIDVGPHRLSPNLPFIRMLVEEMLGSDVRIHKNQHGVCLGGKTYQFPPRIQDWVSPASFWALCAFGASFFWNKITWILRRFDEDTFESVMVRKFGRRFYTRIAEPMASKVWGNSESIDPAFVNQRFSLIYPWEIVKARVLPRQELNPSTFLYPRKGFQQLWDSASDHISRSGAVVELGAEPLRIDVKDGRIICVVYRTPHGESVVEGDGLHVVSTIPITQLLSILHGFPTDELLEIAQKIKIRSMILVAMEFSRSRILPFRIIIAPERKYRFNRLFEQNAYSPDTVTGGKSIVIADLTVPKDSDALSMDDATIIEAIKKDLLKMGGIPVDKISDSAVFREEFAYVVPDVETRRAFSTLKHLLKPIANLDLIGRFSAGEYDNSDYALDNGIALAQMLSGSISRLEYLLSLHAKKQRVIVG